MNIKCALIGHDWVVHSRDSNYSGKNFCKFMVAIVCSILSAFILVPLFIRIGWFVPEEIIDATCTRCEKMTFEAEDYQVEKKAAQKRRGALKVKHERMAALRAKARG